MKVRMTKLAGLFTSLDPYPVGYWVEGSGKPPLRTFNVYVNPIYKDSCNEPEYKMPKYHLTGIIKKVISLRWGKLVFVDGSLWKWEEVRQ
jgi:hypothetical protein